MTSNISSPNDALHQITQKSNPVCQLTVALSKFRKMIGAKMNNKQNNIEEYARLVSRSYMAVDALASLIESESSFTRFCFQQTHTKYLSEFIYELYVMYELCIQIDVNCPYLNYVQKVLNTIEYYVVCICGSLGERVWKHFELVDKEIRDLMRNPEEVELLKFMAIGGFTRPEESKNISKANPMNSDLNTKDDFI